MEEQINYTVFTKSFQSTFQNSDENNNLQTIAENFLRTDYIMEPSIYLQLKRYLQAGGNPEFVVRQLSINYKATAQIVNVLAELLILAGLDKIEVQAIIENHLKEIIIKNFDPKRADTIFTEEGETPLWLTMLIEHKIWRDLIFSLAEEYPDCSLLKFTIKLISDAGYYNEITSNSLAAQQFKVFSSVLLSSMNKVLFQHPPLEENWKNSIEDLTKMICYGQHTYVFSQILIHNLMKETKYGIQMKRISQEIQQYALRHGLNVAPITMALYENTRIKHPQACNALMSMLSKNFLNPADISILHRCYSSTDQNPPIDLIRNPQFLDLLVNSLFKTGVKINHEHKCKYIYLLAYAVSVVEMKSENDDKTIICKEDLKPTIDVIEKVHYICNLKNNSLEFICEIQALYDAIKFPVIGVGVIRWIEITVTDPTYFKLNTDSVPIHLAILDEIASVHSSLHDSILGLLIQLFESKQNEHEILVELELKKMLVDRMINLLICGYVIPIVKYMKKCLTTRDTDVSLIRYFVIEVLETIAQPYSLEFIKEFLPMVENEDIINRDDDEEYERFTEFILQARTTLLYN